MRARSRPESAVRTYRRTDREAFLDLYERVWGRRRSAAWFDWRFEANPFGDEVEMVVAERDGRLIGAEPLLPFPLRVGDVDVRAFQPADWIVDPAYRNQGVFTRMTEQLFESYADDAALLFNFPSDALLPGLESFDWRVVGAHPMAYRFQRPSDALSSDSDRSHVGNAALAVGDAVAGAVLPVLDRSTWRHSGVSVERRDGVPRVVGDLYDDAPPDGFHVPRDDAFLEWRFSNPRWTTTTYVAHLAGNPVVAVVTAVEEQADGQRVLRVLDVQPADDQPGRERALTAIYDELIRHARDVAVVRTPVDPLPGPLRRGFLRDDAVGVSRLSNTTTQVVRPLSDGEDLDWRLAGRSLTDPANWALSLADQDVA